MKKINKKTIVLSVILVFLLAALGCSQKPPENAVKQTTQNAGSEKQVTIAYIAMPMTSPQALVGIDEKIFENTLAEKGRKVKWVHTRSLDNIWPMMDKGEVDLAYIPTNNFTTYVAESSKFGGSDKFRIIAGSLNHDLYILMAKPHIKSLKDLDGKTVGIVNHFYMEEFMLNKQLADAGLKTKVMGGAVNVEYIDVMGNLMQNFAGGKYDAVCTWTEQQGAFEQKAPGSRLLTNLNAGKFGAGVPQNSLVAKNELIRNNPELIKLVLKAHLKANETALSKQDKLPLMAAKAYENYFTNEIKASGYQTFPGQFYIQQWEDAVPTYDPNVDFLKKVFDFEVKAGYLKGKTMDNIINLGPLNEVLKEQGKPPVKEQP